MLFVGFPSSLCVFIFDVHLMFFVLLVFTWFFVSALYVDVFLLLVFICFVVTVIWMRFLFFGFHLFVLVFVILSCCFCGFTCCF